MKIFQKHLLFFILIALLSRNAAEIFSLYEDTFMQDADSLQDETLNYRLPTSVKPILYEIMLIPDLEDSFTFEGIIKITAVIEHATNIITLNVGNIQIKSQSVVINDTNIYDSYTYDKNTEKYSITVQETLKEGTKILIAFTYEGILNDNMIGFYRSSYIDENGQIKQLAATQFQPTHARHAFPCFDEPSFKAKFLIRISRLQNYICLSNMPLEQSIKAGNRVWDTFQESIPMSTYLVAFVISEFRSLEQDEFRVWTKPTTIDQAKYALKIGTTALENLAFAFQLEYNLPKMDMVAVPDFAPSAMENWGLVTYRESRMLYDEKESSTLAQQNVVSVIVHELTHMWFGNMVTPEWWGYLWLSEAFARYFQYFGTADIEVSWNMREQFVVQQHQAALIVDGLEPSRPMTRKVSSPKQIGEMGDSITYSKGASVVRMMNLIFGNNIFNQALCDYLERNKEKGLGNPDALWTVLQNQINIKSSALPTQVKTIMDTWTMQAGYPVVSITVNDKDVRVTQERFFLRNLDKTSTNVTWWVPLTWTTQKKSNFNNTSPKYWLSTKEKTINFKTDPKEWLIFNIQSSGFYRVNYNHDGWQRIFSILNSNFGDIHVLNRAALMDDLLNLGRAGYQDYKTVLDGTTYLRWETNYLPFKAALKGLNYLNKRMTGYKEHALFKKYVLSLINGRHKELGYEDSIDDDRLTILLRQDINNWLCNLDDEKCVKTYVDKFKKWKANISVPIKPNERTTAYCVAIKNGTAEDWEFLWKQYYNSNNAADQTVIINALGCSLNTTILERYLGYAITSYQSNRIRKQDSTKVFAAVYDSGLIGAEYILDFVDKYYKEMEKYYKGQNTIATILNGASQHLSTLKLVDKFESLINKYKTEFAPIIKSLEYSLKIARYELWWYKTASVSIIQWLEAYEYSNITTAISTKSTVPTVSSTTTPTSLPDVDEDMTKYRLPENIKPKRYNISVKPYLEIGNFTFDGTVKIEAGVDQETNQIILHSADIKHREVTVRANEKEVEITKKDIISKYDFYVIDLAENLIVGTNLTIEIAYTGHLNVSELRGFYKSSYVNNAGETRWLAATHLEPVGARKMFPCFDEPAMKAVFTITVIVPRGYHSLSNMDVFEETEDIDGRQSFTFFDSPKMSTYLVAVIVSDFTFDSIRMDEIRFSVYARPNAINQTRYALSVISPLVEFFETRLKRKYKIPKLDMVALPDFPAGAMENWGLLTYKETNLLYDENHSPFTSKQIIRNIIAHEISHQWFGNLVSPQWWKYLWLNEGFGRYFEYHAPAIVFEEPTLEWQFVVDQVHSALNADSYNSTHPVSHDVYSPKEIRSIFDTISYAKAASILRMIEKSFGSEIFYEALSSYLNKRKYDVATPEDLYEALQVQIKNAGRTNDIKAILNTWTTQPGYPVVHIDIKEDIVIFKQERFFLKNCENLSTDVTWHIPITWTSVYNTTYNNTTPRLWLTEKEQHYRDLQSFQIRTLNVQQAGFYRVNYNKDHWLKLIGYLKSRNYVLIHEINRAALVDDLMNLGRADYVDYRIVIEALTYLNIEWDYLPYRAFYNNLPYLINRFREGEMNDLFQKYLKSFIIRPIYRKLGFIDSDYDNNLTKMLRMYAREWACKLDIAECRYEAARLFYKKSRYDDFDLEPNCQGVVYCTAMRTDKTRKVYNYLWKEYLNSNITAEKLIILSSLACSQNRDILETLLLAAVTENSPIRFQNSAKIFSDVYDESLIGVEVIMNFIKEHYDIMYQHFGGYMKIQSIVSSLANKLSTYKVYQQYQNLLEWLVNKEPEFKKSVDTYLLNAQYEFDWYKKQAPEIFEGLDKTFIDTFRLPHTHSPEMYNVSLTPFMENSTFEGKVQIYMKVNKNMTSIFLNAQNLRITNVTVYRNYAADSDNSKAEEIPVSNYTTIEPLQQLKIYLAEFINAEKIMAEIEFTGILNDDMTGFYRSSYLDKNGELHWLATTQFESTYARKAFPCFDEPAFKSKFIINIQRPNHYNTLSNMPLLRHTLSDDANYTWDTFKTTEKMSSYLVAFVISEFEPLKEEKEYINVWGRPEVVKYGYFAYGITKSVITEMENFTGIKYALPKLDLVAIPDFDMGAMENWGLVTFREYALFFNKEVTTGTYERYMITTVAHELVHMWFGNLVTCEWWEYIWLNEGFAEYFQYFTADLILPSYRFMDQFVVYELQSALLQDALVSAQPMTNHIDNLEMLNDIFGYVTYEKSSSILRMIFNALDEEVHKLAIRDYLKKHQGGTVLPTDLWKSFEPYASIPINDLWNVSIEEVMETWTNQPGYPVVHAQLHGSILTLHQERFLINREKRDFTEFYWIPINVVTSSSLLFQYNDLILSNKTWLGLEPKEMYINPNNEWFIVNFKQTGFYRVNYDTYSWKRLINELNSSRYESIHVLNRAQIIDDLFNLARAGYVEYNLLMNASNYLIRETDHLPWKAFFNGMSYVYERFEEQHYQKLLVQYISNLISNIYNKVGFNDNVLDKHLDELNRELILQWACKVNKFECVNKSLDLFAAWRNGSSEGIPRNARVAVYCTAIRNGTSKDWIFLWEKYLQTNFASEKKIILNALGCSMDKAVIYNYLDSAIHSYVNSTIIRKQDIETVFASVYTASQFGVNITLHYLIANFKDLHDYYGNWNDVKTLFYNLASHISDKRQYKELFIFSEKIYDEYPYIDIRNAVEIALANIKWFHKYNKSIVAWFNPQENKPGSSSAITPNIIFVMLIALISYFLNLH